MLVFVSDYTGQAGAYFFLDIVGERGARGYRVCGWLYGVDGGGSVPANSYMFGDGRRASTHV